jgi:hypothetical protein
VSILCETATQSQTNKIFKTTLNMWFLFIELYTFFRFSGFSGKATPEMSIFKIVVFLVYRSVNRLTKMGIPYFANSYPVSDVFRNLS